MMKNNKKLILSILLLGIIIVTNAQVRFPDKLEHNNPMLPLIEPSQVKGGVQHFNTIAERNSFPIGKRDLGMIVTYPVNDTMKVVVFNGTTVLDPQWVDPFNWKSITGSTSVSGNNINFYTITDGDTLITAEWIRGQNITGNTGSTTASEGLTSVAGDIQLGGTVNTAKTINLLGGGTYLNIGGKIIVTNQNAVTGNTYGIPPTTTASLYISSDGLRVASNGQTDVLFGSQMLVRQPIISMFDNYNTLTERQYVDYGNIKQEIKKNLLAYDDTASVDLSNYYNITQTDNSINSKIITYRDTLTYRRPKIITAIGNTLSIPSLLATNFTLSGSLATNKTSGDTLITNEFMRQQIRNFRDSLTFEANYIEATNVTVPGYSNMYSVKSDTLIGKVIKSYDLQRMIEIKSTGINVNRGLYGAKTYLGDENSGSVETLFNLRTLVDSTKAFNINAKDKYFSVTAKQIKTDIPIFNINGKVKTNSLEIGDVTVSSMTDGVILGTREYIDQKFIDFTPPTNVDLTTYWDSLEVKDYVTNAATITLNDGILDARNNGFEPYTSQFNGVFYRHSDNPNSSAYHLKYNGPFYPYSLNFGTNAATAMTTGSTLATTDYVIANQTTLNGATGQIGQADMFKVLSDTIVTKKVTFIPFTNATATGAITLNLGSYSTFELTLTGNITLDYSNATTGSYTILFKQDATGSRTLTFAAGKWQGSGVSLTSAANSYTLLSCYYSTAFGVMVVTSVNTLTAL